MKLNNNGIKNRAEWEKKGYSLPTYDRDAVCKRTAEAPMWVHFGAGNIFRAFQAALVDKLLCEGVFDRGITVAEGFDYEIIEKMNRPADDLSVLVTLKADGSIEKKVIGSVAESRMLDPENEKEFARLCEIFENSSLQMTTFTITEKGYSLTNATGETLPAVAADFENGAKKPVSYMGKVTALLYARYKKGAYPIAMVSTDNCSHNGDKLKAAVSTYADEWCARGLCESGFADYIKDPQKVSFPWSMIDKITPRPDSAVMDMLAADGLEDCGFTVTSKNTYVAPFVNAEECEYLVVEDAFPAGRPTLEKGGVIFTDRETVDKVEKMKVCTCLNPLHTALAVYGCLLGYKKISDEMKDGDLLAMIKEIGYTEGLPVVTDPGVIEPKSFIDTVVNVRLPNPFMPDTPQRIATDTSQKLSVRFGETVKKYIAEGRDLSALRVIPLAFAGWMRYLMAIGDDGNTFELSPDPLMDQVRPYVEGISLGDKADRSKLMPLLKNEKIFGSDLEKIGMAERVLDLFDELNAGVGAIRATLKKYTGRC